MSESRSVGLATALAANLLIFLVLAYVAGLNAFDEDLYYATLQEDEYLEWATFWSFMGAAVINVVAGMRQHRTGKGVPWFLFGTALFCFVVGMEEISWAQRVIGYRPPAYFLEHNFQQEFNVHNVFSTDFRKLGVKITILGYGVVLPSLALIPPIGRLLRRIAVVWSPTEFVPAFLVTYIVYETYPWKYSGETVELMLGLGFLFAAMVRARELRAGVAALRAPAMPLGLLAAFGAVLALGLGNAAVARVGRSASPELMKHAEAEVEALRKDFLRMARENRGKLVTHCDIHKRVYSYERKYRKPFLYKGEYSGLVKQGMPEERADFFLDPWNDPYWIRDRCDSDDSDERRVFIYSFGPNRRRDSNKWEIRGDDVGAYIAR